MTIPGRTRNLTGLVLAASFLAGLAVGCRVTTEKPNLQDLFISNRRFSINEDRGVVRVFGRLENVGQSHFDAVEVRAVLVSAGGDPRGENSVLLQKIKPREKRDFALAVTSHARTHDVRLEIREPVSR